MIDFKFEGTDPEFEPRGCPIPGACSAAVKIEKLQTTVDDLLQSLRDLLGACETEVNEKGGSGYILGRMSDARLVIFQVENNGY